MLLPGTGRAGRCWGRRLRQARGRRQRGLGTQTAPPEAAPCPSAPWQSTWDTVASSMAAGPSMRWGPSRLVCKQRHRHEQRRISPCSSGGTPQGITAVLLLCCCEACKLQGGNERQRTQMKSSGEHLLLKTLDQTGPKQRMAAVALEVS